MNGLDRVEGLDLQDCSWTLGFARVGGRGVWGQVWKSGSGIGGGAGVGGGGVGGEGTNSI